MDQVRGAIFSSLAESVPGARVLDFFAGAGSLGIEALSRGAASATFVERDRKAVECIRRNLEKTRLAPCAELLCLDVFTALEKALPARRFDLVFADPPYVSRDHPDDLGARLLQSAVFSTLLAPDGIFVLEKSPRHELPPLPDGWTLCRQKRYGTTEVLFFRRAESSV